MNAKYKIDRDKCIKCKLCTKVCTVYDEVDKDIVEVHPEFCIECGHCESVCPKQAITGPYEVKLINNNEVNSSVSSEDLLELLKSRRSIRKYKSQKIRQEDLEKILTAAQLSPTGANAQDIKMIIINDKEEMDNLRQEILPNLYKMFGMATKIAKSPLGKYILGEKQSHKMKNVYGPAMEVFEEKSGIGEDRLFYNAPALMITYGEKQDEAIDFSSHIAMTNCMLMAETLGIGTLLNSFALMVINQNKKLKDKLGIPKGNKCFGVMCMGYKDIKYNKEVYRKPIDVNYIGNK